MRASLRHLATHTPRARRSTNLSRTGLTLQPPLSLYRRILRTHRKVLPLEARLLGDEYVKAEFRLHKDVDNPVHIVGFLTEWQLYAQQLEGGDWRGKGIDREKLEKMSDEQIRQLYELMQAVKGEGEEAEGVVEEGLVAGEGGAEGDNGKP